MGRRVVILLALLVLLVGGAGLVYQRMFADEADAPVVQAPPPRPRPVVTAPPGDAGGAPDAGLKPLSEIRVVETTGTLERRAPGAGDAWERVEHGDVLAEKDAVRTARDGTAVLQVGGATRVRMAGRSEVQLKKVADGQVRVRLVEGRVAADVAEDGSTVLQVETQGSDAVAETRGGRFAMMSDGRGQVAVATETGQVRLRARGKDVEVPAGRQSVVNDGKAPSAPSVIPATLLLKVATPGQAVQREPETEVVGQASPGALVRVKDKQVRVDDRGNFRVRVPLREGTNTVEVSAVDVSGREKSSSFSVRVDSTAPQVKGRMNWGGN